MAFLLYESIYVPSIGWSLRTSTRISHICMASLQYEHEDVFSGWQLEQIVDRNVYSYRVFHPYDAVRVALNHVVLKMKIHNICRHAEKQIRTT